MAEYLIIKLSTKAKNTINIGTYKYESGLINKFDKFDIFTMHLHRIVGKVKKPLISAIKHIYTIVLHIIISRVMKKKISYNKKDKPRSLYTIIVTNIYYLFLKILLNDY